MKMTSGTIERVPMILTGHALQSLRDSGHSPATAFAEVVDNSLEANANRIQLFLFEHEQRRKRRVHQVVFVDDGDGMDEHTLRHYLQLGFSTRYMSTTTIGKYGVGAKLAALSYARRIDVWSRTSATDPWRHVYFSLDEALEAEERGEEVGIPPLDEVPFTEDVTRVVDIPEGSGTVVLWSEVDRLEEGRFAKDANQLRVDVEKELARIFRYFLADGISITVGRTDLLPYDPLFTITGSWNDQILREHQRSTDGEQHFEPRRVFDQPVEVVDGEAFHLRVYVHPKEVVRERGKGGDKLAWNLRVPDNQGQLSFVRLNREIAYTNVPRIFPTAVEDPDRFIGIEVRFTPNLDGYFGVRNVKRGVEPHGQLRVQIREKLQSAIEEARKIIQDDWGDAERKSRRTKGQHQDVEEAVKEANRTMPKARAKTADDEDIDRIFEDLAKDVGIPEGKEREEYVKRARELPFVVESVDFPGTNFIDVRHVDGQVIVRINTRHRFYREVWEPLQGIAAGSDDPLYRATAKKTARRAVEALTLLLIAYGKAESMHEHPHEQYADLRAFWGQFLDTLMNKVKGTA